MKIGADPDCSRTENVSSPFPLLTVTQASQQSVETLYDALRTCVDGLSPAEAARRRKVFGLNHVATEKPKTAFMQIWQSVKDPLFLLLSTLGCISFLSGDYRATVLIAIMLVLSASLRFYQERRGDRAAEKLKAMVRVTSTVLHSGKKEEVLLAQLVPGDVVLLSAGDMIPADVRLLFSRDLTIDQSSLTGESVPVEKHAEPVTERVASPFDLSNICFMGTNVGSGTATAVVVATGGVTAFGSLASQLAVRKVEMTSFDRGVDRFTKLMIRFMLVMVPIVFIVNGFGRGNWSEAFLFGLAVAVGLTPELLPVMVTVNLSKAAMDMSKKRVIVKRLNAIQDFGAMDILCTDKTGTLTQGKVVLIEHVDIFGKESETVFDYAFLNSTYQTGLKNLMDAAVINHDGDRAKAFSQRFRKIDEIPFDFKRRRMSVVAEDADGTHLLICKGAVEEVLAHTTGVLIDGETVPLHEAHHLASQSLLERLGEEGFRLIALGVRTVPVTKKRYSVADEDDLTLYGFLAFLDPPKETAARAIEELRQNGVAVKILTGDNERVTRKICREVGLPVEHILLGSDIERLSDDELALAAEEVTVFDKMEPQHKERVIRALQRRGHVVGYLGDGINDAPALKTADVGISVDSAVDIAKESSDFILLEKSLLVLKDGVREGRRAFGNILKFIKMTASSNFGNMLSVVGASLFMPFLPMLPLQIIANNLLYDLSQTTIPTDAVDEEYLVKPRQWRIDHLKTFILCIGPVSSLFDYATFFIMLFVFNAWANPALFHTGWFVESVITQTLIVHIIRTKKIPFIQSRASWPLTITTLLVVAFGVWLPFSPFARVLGFVSLPPLYWVIVFGFVIAYFILTQMVKNWFTRRYGWE